jgi:cellulose synthase/poly-beta-1,6-N-acetylglucosamine synthase-like glycosyltransferase
MPWPLILILVFGVSLTFWTVIGALRWAARSRHPPAGAIRLDASTVAVVIPAHNEEPCIAATLQSVVHLAGLPKITGT